MAQWYPNPFYKHVKNRCKKSVSIHVHGSSKDSLWRVILYLKNVWQEASLSAKMDIGHKNIGYKQQIYNEQLQNGTSGGHFWSGWLKIYYSLPDFYQVSLRL